MDKELTIDETRLFDLLEKFDFSELKKEDQVFVLMQMSQEDYVFQRKVMMEAENVMDLNLSPNELKLPSTQKKNKGIVIPLYQALLAVASVIVVFVILWPKQESLGRIRPLTQVSKNVPVVQTKIVHDTVLKYIPQIKYIERTHSETKIEYVTVYQNQPEEPQLLETAQSFNLPAITKTSIQNKGNSLKEDQSSRFILPIIGSN